jgi:hypothetical protein
MTDRTRQIVEALLRAPELVQALKQDPNAFAARLGLGERELQLLQTGKRLVSDFASRLLSQDSSHCGAASNPNWEPFSARGNGEGNTPRSLPATKNSSNVALVSVTALAAITGMLAALGTIAVVGINSNGHSDDIA